MLNQILEPGGRFNPTKLEKNAIRPRGVLSGILLRGWESQPHGEGPDGSTQLAKETYAGHVGPVNHKPTSALASCVALPPASKQSSLQGIVIESCSG